MKSQLKLIAITGFLAFLTIFIVEHFSSTSIVNSRTTIIKQITPFGTEIIHDLGTVPCVFTKVETGKVSYFGAVFKDFKYLILIWVLFIVIGLFVGKTKSPQNQN